MRIIEYEFNNILELPRIKELLKMKCAFIDDYGGVERFMNIRNTLETQFHDTFIIDIENSQREYETFDENGEIVEYNIGEILTGHYTKLTIIEIEWICGWGENLGYKRIYEWSEVTEFREKPPF